MLRMLLVVVVLQRRIVVLAPAVRFVVLRWRALLDALLHWAQMGSRLFLIHLNDNDFVENLGCIRRRMGSVIGNRQLGEIFRN